MADPGYLLHPFEEPKDRMKDYPPAVCEPWRPPLMPSEALKVLEAVREELGSFKPDDDQEPRATILKRWKEQNGI